MIKQFILSKATMIAMVFLVLITIVLFNNINATHSESFQSAHGTAHYITGRAPSVFDYFFDYSELVAQSLMALMFALTLTPIIKPKSTTQKIFIFSSIALVGYLFGEWLLANATI